MAKPSRGAQCTLDLWARLGCIRSWKGADGCGVPADAIGTLTASASAEAGGLGGVAPKLTESRSPHTRRILNGARNR